MERDIPFFIRTPLRMAGFCKGGFGFCLQRSRQNLDPSEIFFKGADKQSTLRISFFKGHRQKIEGSDSCHP